MSLHDTNKIARLERKIERLEAALKEIMTNSCCENIGGIACDVLEETKP